MSESQSSLESSLECGELSLVAQFDDLMRLINKDKERNSVLECAFIDFVEQTRLLNKYYSDSVRECRRLQVENDELTHNYNELESKLGMSRKLFDQERKHRKRAEEERDDLKCKIGYISDLLVHNYGNRIPQQLTAELGLLNNNPRGEFAMRGTRNDPPELSAINEVNTTGSLLSDLSYSRSEDDLDVSRIDIGKSWRIHRPSGDFMEPANKKRRSTNGKSIDINHTDTVRATTTVTVPKEGPITATSIIEAVPSAPSESPVRKAFTEMHPSAPPEHLVQSLWQRNSPTTAGLANLKQHSFQTRTVVMPENCSVCNKRISFGKQAVKCKQCRSVCHLECQAHAVLPCVTLTNLPNSGSIADYTPTTPPMIPALIIQCLNEIETRGLKEIGIYRIPGSEREVQSLKEKLIRGRSVPNLNQIDIHVICGAVKMFLRSLDESLITHSRWNDFVRATTASDSRDIAPIFSQIISELPRPNRDTLALLMLHLKRIAEAPECKMNVPNLSKVFAPTIVGYSSSNVNKNSLITETKQIVTVMEHLINLSVDYWSSFLNFEDNLKTPTNKLQQTPSTDSLLCSSAKRGFLTFGSRSTTKKKQQIFPTPFNYK